MKSSTIRSLVVVLSLLLIAGACRPKEKASANGEKLDTIAPAKPQPEATGTDAMTQTVELDDKERPPTEGGAVSEGSTATAATVTTATTPTAAPPPTTTTR